MNFNPFFNASNHRRTLKGAGPVSQPIIFDTKNAEGSYQNLSARILINYIFVSAAKE